MPGLPRPKATVRNQAVVEGRRFDGRDIQKPDRTVVVVIAS